MSLILIFVLLCGLVTIVFNVAAIYEMQRAGRLWKQAEANWKRAADNWKQVAENARLLNLPPNA